MVDMKNTAKEYIKFDKNDIKAIRLEILLTPLIVIFPLLVSGYLIYDWFTRGLLMNISQYNGELFIALIILIGNILFDVPFIKTLIRYNTKT